MWGTALTMWRGKLPRTVGLSPTVLTFTQLYSDVEYMPAHQCPSVPRGDVALKPALCGTKQASKAGLGGQRKLTVDS